MYTHTMIYFCTELWTEQHTLSEDGKENTCSNGQHLPPRFKLELKLESETTVPHPSERLSAPRRAAYYSPPGERSNF